MRNIKPVSIAALRRKQRLYPAAFPCNHAWMNAPIQIPLWLLILIIAFAAVTFASHFLFPSVRWFFRRRVERAVARLNTRLDRPIEVFKLARRQDMITRVLYDPIVLEAVGEHARDAGIPGNVALQLARSYAREIVPGFSTTLYFGFAARAARWISRGLYRVRIGKLDAALSHIDPKSTVVFVINHRSNMDYILITWLVSSRANLSYAVGEWARIWPLSVLIRAMGAYFIRRGDRNTLYRRVLARYVQIATEQGTTQAIFPEGGLSLTGEMGPAKIGLLSYIAGAAMPEGRDVVFVPVGLAYDRILEDGILTTAATAGTRRFRIRPFAVLRIGLAVFWQMLRGRFAGFGTAAAGFGAPISLRGFAGSPEQLGAHLMEKIAAVVPVVPVNLIAAALLSGAKTEADILAAAQTLIAQLTTSGAVFSLPAMDKLLHHGLYPLIARGIVRADLTCVNAVLLDFYAAPLRQAAAADM